VLVRLEYNQILSNWGEITAAIRASGPPLADLSDEGMDRVLRAFSGDLMQCWVICEVGEDLETIVYAIGTTMIWEDVIVFERNLLIFSLYAYRLVPQDLWRDSFETLRKYARSVNCKNIVAFTVVDKIVDIVKDLGGSVNTRLVKMEV